MQSLYMAKYCFWTIMSGDKTNVIHTFVQGLLNLPSCVPSTCEIQIYIHTHTHTHTHILIEKGANEDQIKRKWRVPKAQEGHNEVVWLCTQSPWGTIKSNRELQVLRARLRLEDPLPTKLFTGLWVRDFSPSPCRLLLRTGFPRASDPRGRVHEGANKTITLSFINWS